MLITLVAKLLWLTLASFAGNDYCFADRSHFRADAPLPRQITEVTVPDGGIMIIGGKAFRPFRRGENLPMYRLQQPQVPNTLQITPRIRIIEEDEEEIILAPDPQSETKPSSGTTAAK